MFQLTRRQLSAVLVVALMLSGAPVHARAVHDIKGKSINIPQNLNRIADLWHANNQVVLLLGGAPKLVATTNVIQKNPWFAAVFPKIKKVPALTDGQSIQPEALMAVRPDAVLMSGADMQRQVERAGMKAVLVNFQDFNGLRKTVKITADVIGGNAPAIAQTYINELDGNISLVSNRLKGLPENQKPSVLHLTGGSNLLEIDGGKSMIGEWVRYAGGRNALPTYGNKAVVSMETLIKAKPDVIIIGSGSQGGSKAVAAIKKDLKWQSIPAVRAGRVYANPSGTFSWDRYSAEAALQILWAAKLMHPDRFKDIDIAAKAQVFYKKYYGYNLSRPNAERIIAGQAPQ